MLNISHNSITDVVHFSEFRSYQLLRRSRIRNLWIVLSLLLLIGVLFSMFLPWTQNIRSKGYVTTRSPDQRPQAIQSVIDGRLEEWFVQEGDFVKKGDTIVFISEVKSEYFDPDLLSRTEEQIDAKVQSVSAYEQKVGALQSQYAALRQARNLKLSQNRNKIEQIRNKIRIDSIDWITAQTNLEIAENQEARTRELHEKGLKSLTELQEKSLKVQAEKAKLNSLYNKYLNQKNELTNALIELDATKQEYTDKLAKSLSDQQSAVSSKMESLSETAKLRNQLSNYSWRQKLYYITAPQSGYVTKVISKGIGEAIKSGSDIVTIMPERYDVAIEMYIRPQDVPLVKLGERTTIRFDGWPAIVLRGWPESSTGIFFGEVVAIDQYIGENGQYRILVSPYSGERPWPHELRVGTGAHAFILLNKVPIWYEIWRQLNGFAPDYYRDNEATKEVKRKKPLRFIK